MKKSPQRIAGGLYNSIGEDMIEWNIASIKVLPHSNGFQDVVTIVLWSIIAYNETNPKIRVDNLGEVTLLPPEGDFKPVNELTKDDVVYWVKEALGVDKVASIEADILNKLSDLEAAGVPIPLPWG